MEIENFQGLGPVNDKCQGNLKIEANAREISEMRFKAIYLMNLTSVTNKLKAVSRYGPQLYRINVLQDFLTNYLALIVLGVFKQKKR